MKKSILFIIIVVSVYLGYVIGVNYSSPVEKAVHFTGQDVLVGLNSYRELNSLPPISLDPVLCNNISTRWDEINHNLSHQGLFEFKDEQIANGVWPEGIEVTELIATSNTVDEAIHLFASSPSHNMFLLTPHNDQGCVYSSFGTTLVFLR